MYTSNSNRSNSDYCCPLVWWTKKTARLTFQLMIRLVIYIVVFSKWLPNSHSTSRYRRNKTTFHSNYAMLLLFLHPERPEVHRAGTPWLLPTSGVCSAPSSIYLTLHPAVSMQWGFAYSETEKAQEVRFWWCSLEGWSKASMWFLSLIQQIFIEHLFVFIRYSSIKNIL